MSKELCITHEPNHQITGYRAPITGNFVCDVCGPIYCTCNEDTAVCKFCGYRDHYQNLADGFSMLPEVLEQCDLDYHDFACIPCYEEKVAALGGEK